MGIFFEIRYFPQAQAPVGPVFEDSQTTSDKDGEGIVIIGIKWIITNDRYGDTFCLLVLLPLRLSSGTMKS